MSGGKKAGDLRAPPQSGDDFQQCPELLCVSPPYRTQGRPLVGAKVS